MMAENLCKLPDKVPTLSTAINNQHRPVGLLIDPREVGDSPKNNEERVRFYPCKVIERDLSGNVSGVAPLCPAATTYQKDFEYRGSDPRRCRTYEFHTDKEKCEIFYCTPQRLQKPTQRFGRHSTDLKPVMKKIYGNECTNAGLDPACGYPIQSPSCATKEYGMKCESEYMASVSKLGGDIIKYNIFARPDRLAPKPRPKATGGKKKDKDSK